jgi:hypothetical protein
MKKKKYLAAKLDLFTIGTITLPKLEIFNVAISVKKPISKILHSIFHTLKDKPKWILPQHTN